MNLKNFELSKGFIARKVCNFLKIQGSRKLPKERGEGEGKKQNFSRKMALRQINFGQNIGKEGG